MPMVGGAGCENVAMATLGKRRVAYQRFAYASYLLGVEKTNGSVIFGVPAYYQVANVYMCCGNLPAVGGVRERGNPSVGAAPG